MYIDIAGAYLNAEMSGKEVLVRFDSTMAAILKSFLCNDSTIIGTEVLHGSVESAKLCSEALY